MHARGGLKTPYLGDEWFQCIRACADKAQALGMQAWAYDENGWPSGFVGGKLLEEQENLENFLEVSYGKVDPEALVSYRVDGARLTRVTQGNDGEEYINIYKRTAVSSVDILDKKVVQKFIQLTHEEYKNRLGADFAKIAGFFTDEPQFCRRAVLYPHVIEEEYKAEYGEDILDVLGLLFIDKEGYQKFRYRYWKTCQRLMLENFARPVYEWCDKNGVQLTGHYIEECNLYMQMLFCAGIMPFYEYEHIPGIDWLCKRYMSVVLARQLGSVCAQLGKKQALTETYAMTGWDATPTELKSICEFQYFFGVNKTCQHLLPYAEYGERKNDHPTHFTPSNPWVKAGFAQFNEYFNKLGGILQAGKEFVNVAMLHPIRSAYFGFQKDDTFSVKELDDAFIGYSEYLAKRGIGFHYLDETLLAKYGFVDGDKIGCGERAYTYLIIPKCYTMDKTTEALVRKFVENGGKVLLVADKPQYLEAELFEYSYLQSNVTIEEIKKAQPYSVDCFYDKVYSVYYQYDGFDCLFLLNTDDFNAAEGKIFVDGALLEVDLEKDEEKSVSNVFKLKPLQSKIFVVEQGEKLQNSGAEAQEIVFPYTNLQVVESSENNLLLDYARYSTDGVCYSEPTAVIGIFDEMLKRRHDGDLYLQFSFTVKELPTRVKILSEYENAVHTLNGQEIVFGDEYYYEKKMRLADIAPFIRLGENVLTVKLRFYQNEKVYYALFGEGVTESLRNCLVYDTYLESIRVLGDFAVYSDSKPVGAANKDVVLMQNFYIGAKKERIKEMTVDGYPFFAGAIKFKEKIRLTDTNVRIKFLGKIHFANVYVNGNKAGELLFNDSVDVSKFAVLGENDIEIETFTGLRNFYGPHHNALRAESGAVSPFAFTSAGSWEQDGSIYERKSYALARAGLFKPNGKPWSEI